MTNENIVKTRKTLYPDKGEVLDSYETKINAKLNEKNADCGAKKIILIIPNTPLTYAKYLSHLTGYFMDKAKTPDEYRMIYQENINKDEFDQKISIPKIGRHFFHKADKDGKKSFSHSKNKNSYNEIIKSILKNKELDFEIWLYDFNDDSILNYFAKINDEDNVFILPGASFTQSKKISENSSNYCFFDMESEVTEDFDGLKFLGKLNNNGQNIYLKINKQAYTDFFKKINLPGQKTIDGYNSVLINSEKTHFIKTLHKNFYKEIEEYKSKLDINLENREKNIFDYKKELLNFSKGDIFEFLKKIDTNSNITFDHFISHQSKDKEPHIKELVEKLESKYDSEGNVLFIWYDENILEKFQKSDYFRKSILHGLLNSKNISFFFTHNYFDKLIDNSNKNYKYTKHFKHILCDEDPLGDDKIIHHTLYSQVNSARKCTHFKNEVNSYYFGINYEASVVFNPNFKSIRSDNDKEVSVKIILQNNNYISNSELKVFDFEVINESNNSLIVNDLLYISKQSAEAIFKDDKVNVKVKKTEHPLSFIMNETFDFITD